MFSVLQPAWCNCYNWFQQKVCSIFTTTLINFSGALISQELSKISLWVCGMEYIYVMCLVQMIYCHSLTNLQSQPFRLGKMFVEIWHKECLTTCPCLTDILILYKNIKNSVILSGTLAGFCCVLCFFFFFLWDVEYSEVKPSN